MQIKNLQNLLGNGNLTPRERFLLLIQNDVEAHTKGKEVLTLGEKAALENWHAKTNQQANEWNTLNEGWKYSGHMGLEGEFYFHDAQAAHLQVRPIIIELLKYPLHREMRVMLENLKTIKKVTPEEAASIAAKQRAVKLEDGLDYEYAVYRLAFERLTQADRDRLLELYADVTTDHQYLDQEELIAHLINGKDTLTKAAKEKLAELIASRAYNAFAKEYQLFHYFACIPLAEVALHFLAWKNVAVGGRSLSQNQEADDEDTITHKEIHQAVEQYAEEHDITIEELLKQGFIHWYDTEGFAYTPLVMSDDKPLFLRWLKAKAAAHTEFQKIIHTNLLTARPRNPHETYKQKLYSKALYDSELAGAQAVLESLGIVPGEKGELDEKTAFESFSDTVITGESLYAWESDLEFITEFKQRIDKYDPNLGVVYAEDDLEHKGEHLDQELLICFLNGKDEPGIFSRYGLSLRRLELGFEGVTFFKEERKGGKTHLKFKSKEAEQMFCESRGLFIAGYAKLLALKEVTDKLSGIYDIDLTFRLTELFSRLDDYIKTHNEALDAARRGPSYSFMSEEPSFIAEVDPDFYIDPTAIAPDLAGLDEHTAKLKELFRDYFS